MLKTYLYIPDHLEKQISQAVQIQKKSKAEILRQALERGIVSMHNQGTASAQALLKLRDLGKRYDLRGPQDSSERIDELLWGKDWSKDE